MSDKRPFVYIVTGEPSGDMLGARLVKALKEATGNNIRFAGIGGDALKEQGLKSLFDITDLSVMGLLEVIPSIPKVLKRIKETVNDIEEQKPDVIITIDSWGFTGRVNKELKNRELKIPQIHYVAPQVWAWKKGRAKTMYKYVDSLLCLLPNEPAYFTPHNLETHFVGHPVIESMAHTGEKEEFYNTHNIPPKNKLVTILPGSRHNEVDRLLPVFKQTVETLNEKYKSKLSFVVPTVSTVSEKVENHVKDWNVDIRVVKGTEDKHNAFAASSAAIAASGTVALELAIAKLPHLVAYIANPITAFIALKICKIKFFNLSNILLKRFAVPEMMQNNCTPEQLVEVADKLLNDKKYIKAQLKDFDEVKMELGFGEQTPSQKAAQLVLNKIKKF